VLNSIGIAWADSIQDAINAAALTGQTVRDSWTSRKALANNVTKPIMTGQTPIRTLDRGQARSISITCPGTATVFQALIQPSATKDLNFITVAYDTDFNGTLDATVTMPGPISGLCANGFVSCTPGTWDNCKWFEWDYNGTVLKGKLGVPGDLGGCYCINSGCSSGSAFDMKNQVLQSIGGGIAGALTAYDARYAVSKAEIDGFSITYYGQNAGGCSMADVEVAGSYPTPEEAFQDPALMTVLTNNEVETQSSNSSSIYSVLANSPARTNLETRTCTMQRDAYFDSATCSVQESSTDQCQALKDNPDCTLVKEVAYDVNGAPIVTYDNHHTTGLTPVTTCRHFDPSSLGSIDINQCIQLGRIQTDGGCNMAYQCQETTLLPTSNLWRCTLPPTGHNDCGDIFQYDICGAVDISWDIPDDPCEMITLGGNTLRDYCPGHSSNTTPDKGSISQDTGSNRSGLFVSLNNEKACNGWAGGSVVVFIQPVIPRDVCHDWWRIERTYSCAQRTGINPDVSRADQVAGSVTESGSSWHFTDPVTGGGQVNLRMKEGEGCIKACKLKKEDRSASAGQGRTTADIRHNPSTTVFIYRTCVDGSCPARPGEAIVTDCTCLEEFGLAYGVMESMRQAAADQVCSRE